MWQLLVYVAFLLIGRLRPQCIPRKLRPLLFIPNSPPELTSSSSSSSPSQELIPFNSSSARDPEILQPNKYDVFISFRGVDVRNSFLSHLYSHLNDHEKLAVYKDDVDLERGEQISPALLLAIERSEVYVVILSPNYADSPWCLEELEKILQCKERYGRRIIPVFYGVDPSDVENQKLPSSNSGKIRSWRAVLEEIANISGFDSQVIRPETKLIEEIVKAVFQAIRRSGSQMLKVSSYSASRGLVGIERKMDEVRALLCLGDRSNTTIGLWGTAGIGKTALAKAFFDLFSCQFEASYFFSNFADTVSSRLSLQPFGNLQSGFFSKLLGHDAVGGTLSYDLTLRRLGRIKALVVIDDVGNDVGNIGQLKDLFNGQYCDLFGPGSIMIMTGRNQQLLKSVCHTVYEVQALDDEEAWQLFCLHAFRGGNVPTEYLDMVEKAIHYVGGNPLAITVLGAHLFGRDLKFWYRELGALQDNLNSVVENVLRRSYDGLSRAEKDVFLDLACFYDYWSDQYLEQIEKWLLEDGRMNLITNLVDKSLISISFGGDLIKMNCLLQDLGRSIVNEEPQIEKRSRLWKSEDIHHLFRENKGSPSIEGIVIYGWDPIAICELKPDAFAKMEHLRFLVFQCDDCNLFSPKDGLQYLPNTLRSLVWHYFTLKSLSSEFSAENLVTLHLQNSKIEQLWEGDEHNVHLGNLKFLNLDGCKSLRKLPNLSTARRLEEIHLWSCESLVELPNSILDLPKLELLDVSDCSNLRWGNLDDYANSSREQSSYNSDILPNLRKLRLSGTPIQKVPNFFIRLQIQSLCCYSCKNLTEFPVVASLVDLALTDSLIEEVVELEKLTELKSLILSENEQLVLLSGDFSKLRSLEVMKLDGCKSLASLPDTIHKLPKLDTLDLGGCYQLRHLPELPSPVQHLDAHGCKSLQSLSIDIVVKHDFSFKNWCFGNCWKLDPKICSKLVDKLAQDCVRIPASSGLLLPGRWGSENGGKEGRAKESGNSKNNAMVTAKFRGKPWKSRATIFCVVLSSLNHLPVTKEYDFLVTEEYRWTDECDLRVECVVLNNKDDDEGKVVSSCNCRVLLEHEDQEDSQSKVHVIVWYTSGPLVTGENVVVDDDDDGSILEFLFQGYYKTTDGWGSYEIGNMIKNCLVIPVYDDRVVTNEDDEEEEGDNDESPTYLQGLFEHMCAHR